LFISLIYRTHVSFEKHNAQLNGLLPGAILCESGFATHKIAPGNMSVCSDLLAGLAAEQELLLCVSSRQTCV